jgi:ornithine--oxo-acid transaminase
MRSRPERARVVVVGAGAGGAALAYELARRGEDVLVLEEGPAHPSELFERPLAERIQRMFRGGGGLATWGRPPLPVLVGWGLGGSTTVSNGTCFRAPERVLAAWQRDFGLGDPGDEGLASHYARVEDTLEVAPVPESLMGQSNRLLARVAAARGLSGAPVRRYAPRCQGAGQCCFGCPTGAKRSADLSYVPGAREHGARFLTAVRVTRVLLRGDRAIGVEAQRADGRLLTVLADTTVLAAGALYSPLLLKASGHRGAHVGRHLRLQPCVKVMALMDEEVRPWEGTPQAYALHHYLDEGVLVLGIQVPAAVGAASVPGLGAVHASRMAEWSRMASFNAVLFDECEGRVLSGPKGAPVVRYSPGANEVGRARRAVAVMADLLFEAGAREVFLPSTGAGNASLRRAEAGRFRPDTLAASELAYVSYHPMGSCRSARDPANGVVDADLAVHGVGGLYVADASVLPSALGVNPQLTIMALATRLATHLGVTPRPKLSLRRPRPMSSAPTSRRPPDADALFSAHVHPTFVEALRAIGHDREFQRAEGAWLVDAEGRRHLDLVAGHGVFFLGRGHPAIREALADALASDLPNLVQLEPAPLAGALAAALLRHAHPGLTKAFFASSGAEVVEAAIKLARRTTGRSRVVSVENGFHGLTTGALALHSGEAYRAGFGPLLPGVTSVPPDDLAALEAALASKEVAAFVVEPIMGHGVHVFAEGYLEGAERLCRRYGTLLVVDEVMTGLGRTGRWYAYEHWNLEPDLVLVSKTLSGGYVPVSACLYTDQIYAKVFGRKDRAGAHMTTFGMNNLAMATGLATLRVLEEGRLVARAARLGELLAARIEAIAARHTLCAGARGRGLMLGVALRAPEDLFGRLDWSIGHRLSGSLFAMKLAIDLAQSHGILTLPAGRDTDVLRLLPPVILDEAEVEAVGAALESAIQGMTSFPGAVVDLVATLTRLAVNRSGR